MTQVVLIVEFEAKPGKETELKDLLTMLIAPTRQEAGCQEYRLHTMPSDPTKFLFYEIWTNQASHAAHGAMPHMAQWHAVKSELVEKVTKSTWLELASAAAE
jgi:quinol monooxygenase YgiN